MTAIDQPTELASEQGGQEPDIAFALALQEAQALRAWLLKAGVDGSTSLDEPLVNAALTKLGRAVDVVQATANVRHELEDAGLDVSQLSDEEVRDLGRRVSEAAGPAFRG